MPPWYLQNSKNWVIFSHAKNHCSGPPPPPELHIRIALYTVWCSFVFILIFWTQIMFDWPNFMCSSGGGGGPEQFFFGNFFQHVKKLLNFWNFVSIKVAKFKLNYLGFYCKPSLFWRLKKRLKLSIFFHVCKQWSFK